MPGDDPHPPLGGNIYAAEHKRFDRLPWQYWRHGWGGAAFDPEHQLLIIPTNRLAAYIRLIPRDKFDAAEGKEPGVEYARQRGTPYGLARTWLMSPKAVPCNPPPFGTLLAIDASTGLKKWEVVMGALPWLPEEAAGKLGSPALGGPIVTGGGIVFLGATLDPFLKAYDVETGALLWKGKLPTSARATPMTYRTAQGKQYVVIAAGGHDVPSSKQDDALVAFAIPGQ